jgi:hypothetical protein
MRCKHCKTKFVPKKFLQKYCLETDDCITAFLSHAKEVKAKQQRAKDKKTREGLKTLTDWQKDLEAEINKIARLIDKGSGCISCGGHTTPAGGHYASVKANGSIRFNLDNIHLQDFNCNNWKSANIINYDLGLIERYGKEYWEYVKFELPQRYPILKLKLFEYKPIIAEARKIVRELEKLDLQYPPKIRLELRKKYNERLGMYL